MCKSEIWQKHCCSHCSFKGGNFPKPYENHCFRDAKSSKCHWSLAKSNENIPRRRASEVDVDLALWFPWFWRGSPMQHSFFQWIWRPLKVGLVSSRILTMKWLYNLHSSNIPPRTSEGPPPSGRGPKASIASIYGCIWIYGCMDIWMHRCMDL